MSTDYKVLSKRDYKVLSIRLYSQFPIFGSCIRQRSAQALSTNDSPKAVKLLAQVVTSSADRKVIAIALESLRNLVRQDSINALCQIWSETRHKDLTTILKNRKYVSTEPNLRVLSALKVESFDIVTKCGVEVLEPLLLALNDKDSQVASNAANCIIRLENNNTIDEICKRWASSRNSQLEEIVQQGNYIAYEPNGVRVLTALKFNQNQMIVDAGVEILEPLLEALNDKDAEIIDAAKVCISQLKNKQTIDGLCKKWMGNQSSDLQKMILKANYEPSESITKALFYFLLGEWQKYEDLDFDLSLITKAYYSADEEGKKRIADKSKAGGRIEWVKILTNSKQGFNVEKMTDEDWKSFIDILVAQPDRKEIWRFLYNAPPIWSKRLLDTLFNISLNWYKKVEEDIVKRLLTLARAFEDQDFWLLLLAGDNHLKTLTGYKNADFSVAISSDCKLLVSVSGYETIGLWSLPDGNHFKTLSGLASHIDSLAISADSKLLVSGSYDGTIRLWSLPDGNHLKTLTSPTRLVRSLAISTDGQILVSGSGDEDIRLWSLPSGNHLKTLRGHNRCCVRSLAISLDSKLLVSGNDDKTIQLWSLPDGNHLKTFSGGHRTFAISPDSKLLVSDDYDNSIRLWSLPDGNHLKTLTGHTFSVNSLAISPDSKVLVSGSSDNTIRLWSLPEGNHVKTLTGHTDSVYSLAISSDSKLLVSGGQDDTIRLWSLPNGSHMKTLIGHTHTVRSLAISPDSKLLVSGAQDRTNCLWSLPYLDCSISKYTTQEISEIELKSEDSDLEEGIRNASKFTLALIRLRQQFDIDIEEESDDIELSPFDIEIE
jgi:WD40 repeat protein